ncbi:MAG: peptidoglycan-binding protein, partial [Candidatus Omnitrophica bacterium]|nr:peptidoglycan-binding protein [Candidatus Omnitrophota bacterium]
FIYGVLQKEGAQEKKILGDVTVGVYSEQVELTQKLLAVNGFSTGKIDGKLGGLMRDAIAKFQTANNLKETRFIDDATWAALNVFTRSGLVKDGKIDFVTVQTVLKKAGLDVGAIDGNPGPKTVRAIKSFQKKSGLQPDGRIGPKTLEKLNEALLEK